MPLSKKKQQKTDSSIVENSNNEGIVGMLISLHTFPLESDEELQERKKIVDDIIINDEIKVKNNDSAN